jgi:hypothetical protein
MPVPPGLLLALPVLIVRPPIIIGALLDDIDCVDDDDNIMAG